MSNEYLAYETKMQSAIVFLESQFNSVRAGRANASVLDQISISYYGTQTPIAQVASVSSPDPRTLTIGPWDVGVLGDIEKAISASDLGINPQNDGKVIRLSFPQLTEERRKDLIKQVKKYGEDCKVSIRNIRRDAVEAAKKEQKAAEMTEDDLKNTERDLQKLTDRFVKEIDDLTSKKEKELAAL